MKKGLQFLVFALLILILSCSKSEESSDVAITSISPESGGPGIEVTITGKNFMPNLTDNIVAFNGTTATLKTATVTQLVAVVPTGAGTGPVTVQVGGNTTMGPVFTYVEGQVTQPYYIKYKVNGVWRVSQTGIPADYESCGNCACSVLPPLSESNNAEIDICNAENDWIVASDITGWNQKTIAFTKTVFPNAGFGYKDNGVQYHSDFAASQTNSNVKITSVEYADLYVTKRIYKVKGTFQCNVAKSSGGADIAITEGEFVVRFAED